MASATAPDGSRPQVKVTSTHGYPPRELPLPSGTHNPKLKRLRGAQMVVATADRMHALLAAGQLISLRNLEWLVIDEAVELLVREDGFPHRGYISNCLQFLDKKHLPVQVLALTTSDRPAVARELARLPNLTAQRAPAQIQLPSHLDKDKIANLRFGFRRAPYEISKRFEAVRKEMIRALDKGFGHFVISCRDDERCAWVSNH